MIKRKVNEDYIEEIEKVRIVELKKNNQSFNNLVNKNVAKAVNKVKNVISHKRNVSQAEIIQNNLNISLFAYENNGKINNYFKSPKRIANNNSFAFNNNLLNKICNPTKTEVNEEQRIIEESNVEQSEEFEKDKDKDRNTITLTQTQTQTLQTEQNQNLDPYKAKGNEELSKFFKNLNKKFDKVFTGKPAANASQNDLLQNQTIALNVS